MNIFYLDKDQQKAVEYHVDKHVVKMPIECAQILSTVARERCGIDIGYKSVFINHACTKWAGSSFANFKWLFNFGVKLCFEYNYRYGRDHATLGTLWDIRQHIDPIKEVLSDNPFQEPPKCVSPEFKHLPTVEAYRQYYINVKQRLFKWTNREIPYWLGEV